MSNEEQRTSDDVAFARKVGSSFGVSRTLAGGYPFRIPDLLWEPVSPLVGRLAEAVRNHLGIEEEFLSEEARERFEGDLRRIRMSFTHSSGEVLAIGGLDNAFRLNLIVDLENEAALHTVEAIRRNAGPGEGASTASLVTGDNNQRFIVKMRSVDASRHFMTLFTDAIRSLASAFIKSGARNASVTVHSRTNGYNLEAMPQYALSPFAFGNCMTTPVTDHLTSGNYYFQGRCLGVLIQDPGLHYLGPSRRSTSLSAF